MLICDLLPVASPLGPSHVLPFLTRPLSCIPCTPLSPLALQVPQFLLDAALERGAAAWCSVVVTQPRRIAAVSLASRVAAERCEAVGQTVSCRQASESRR